MYNGGASASLRIGFQANILKVKEIKKTLLNLLIQNISE
jgi:hypothetical protein